MTNRSSILSITTFLGVILGVHFVWGWPALIATWSELPFTALLLFVGLYWLTYGIRAYRIAVYFKSPQSSKLPLGALSRVVVKQTFWANILPAKTGEVSFPLLMKTNFAIDYVASIPALLVLRLFDAYVLGAIALAMLLQVWQPIAAVGLLVATFWLPLVGVPLRAWLIRSLFPLRDRKFAWYGLKLLRNIPTNRKLLIQVALLSWLNWAVKIALFAGLLASLAQLPISQTWLAALVGEVSGLLPGLPAGFGNYEAAVTFGLMPYMSTESTSAIIAAALNAHLFILFNSVFGALVAYALPTSQGKR